MRLVCLHADTIDALKRLSIQFDDLTPDGLWSSQYHLVGLTRDQLDALETFRVPVEDVTPAQLVEAPGEETPAAAVRPSAQGAATARPAGGQRVVATAGTAGIAGTPDDLGGERTRAATGPEAEVPLTQGRDAATRAAEAKAEARPDAKSAGQGAAQAGITPTGAQPAQTSGGQAAAAKSAGGKGAAPLAAPAGQGGRKGQPVTAPSQGSSQRYGTTRLRISVAGKYTEATVANGKIVVGGRAFDSPDQAAAELTKSRGDWTFWEYYDSADGKWRMLTRDWDTVLKSAAPGGR